MEISQLLHLLSVF